ncbi:MAG TPA: dihydrodipicolinate reductase [Sphingobium sp.]|nr:dihydrodipicolinate reductase [Sphingobium sp.]
MKRRVIHCGTGNTGKAALKGILHHPDLELVGQYVWSPDKVGVDAGDICGEGPTGIKATDNLEALLALDADCLSFFGDAIGRADACYAMCAKFLERGTNVASFSGFELAHPPSAPARFRDPVEAACRKGNSSYFFSGIDPGWATTDLAIAALASADRVDCVRVLELGWWGNYTAEYVCREFFGFGKPPGYQPILITGGFMQTSWEPTLRHIADVLGVEIDGWETVYETDCLDHDIETGFGTVEAGTAVAVRFELRAMAGGQPIAICEHVDAVGHGAGKDWKWPYGPFGCVHRIEIEGDPMLSIEVGSPTTGPSAGLRCAMPVINAIPALCEAPPGILGPLDLPRYWTRNVRPIKK